MVRSSWRCQSSRSRTAPGLDNLCHTLVGVTLAQSGFKGRTGRAVLTGAIAANLPDLDVLVFLTDTPSVAFRRGITHGVPAQLLLPVALTAAVWWLHRGDAGRGMRDASPGRSMPVRFRADTGTSTLAPPPPSTVSTMAVGRPSTKPHQASSNGSARDRTVAFADQPGAIAPARITMATR